ncbi:MAG: SGNH/GDSL hydrolase family protein [Ginsengibacter sp.]
MNKKLTPLVIICITAIVITGFRNIHGHVVCFGDSITQGDGHSWVYFLSQEHLDPDFVNAGRSGRKTADKDELLPVLKKYPDANYYLIFLGVNDLKNGNDSMVNICVNNMQWMINEIRKINSKAKIVILAPSDINLKTMNEINKGKMYNENTKQSLYKLDKRYKELAEVQHTGFISLLHAVSKPNYKDGLHPNMAGQKEIAKVVWNGLKKMNEYD